MNAKLKTFDEYLDWYAGLRPELQDIVAACWDYTGRPNIDKPVELALVKLLTLNAERDKAQFVADVQEVLGEWITPQQAKWFHMVFIVGVKYGAEELAKLINGERVLDKP